MTWIKEGRRRGLTFEANESLMLHMSHQGGVRSDLEANRRRWNCTTSDRKVVSASGSSRWTMMLRTAAKSVREQQIGAVFAAQEGARGAAEHGLAQP